MNRIERAALDRDCAPTEFTLPACAAAQELVDSSRGDPTVAPWSDATVICPSGQQLREVTVVEASVEDGVLRMVVPATTDGAPPLAVLVGVPEWDAAVNPPRSNGQEIEFELPGASGFREAWFEISTSDMPATLLDERFADAVTPEQSEGREVARATVDTDGQGSATDVRAEWYVRANDADYEFGAAVELDAERLLRIRGIVTADDGRSPTDDSVIDLVQCVVESIVVDDFNVEAETGPSLSDCRATGAFSSGSVPDDG
jgi:hypothetical protein